MAKTVKVYSTATCPFCAMAKNFLTEHKIAFENVDVGKDKNALMEMRDKSGQMGVPVILVDEKVIVGFDKEALTRELGV
jgi:glutaredoxin 3